MQEYSGVLRMPSTRNTVLPERRQLDGARFRLKFDG